MYWPAVEYGAAAMTHGQFTITVKGVEKKPFYTFSQLEVTNKEVGGTTSTVNLLCCPVMHMKV